MAFTSPQPLVPNPHVHIVAPEDTAFVVMMMQFRAEHLVYTVLPHVQFGRQKHTQGRSREVDP